MDQGSSAEADNQLSDDTGSSKTGAIALWEARLTRGRDGFLASTGNFDLILENDPAWVGVLAFNERSGRYVFATTPPFPDASAGPAARELNDADMARIAAWLERSRFRIVASPNSAALHGAVSIVAERHRFDPVRLYLDALAWDGVSRLDRLFIDYFPAVPDPQDAGVETKLAAYRCAVGSKFMISGVARTYSPGCKVDHALVVEGDQGIGKSTALRVLFGDSYFGDGLPDLHNKDAADYLQGLWLVELAELEALRRNESTALKAFLTRIDDRYRVPYGRRTASHPRRCIFAGSTNQDTFLQDATGNRRFWPVSVASVNLEALSRDRDQLWAEAKHRYLAGETWHLTDPDLIGTAVAEQARRREQDVWQDDVEQYVAGLDFVTVANVLQHGVHADIHHCGQAQQTRVSTILRTLGWKRRQRRGSGRRTWGYAPPEP